MGIVGKKQAVWGVLGVMMFCGTLLYADPRSDGERHAREVQGFINQINTSDKLNKRISKPLTDDAVPLETFTGQQIANAALTRESSDVFLEVAGTQSPSGDMNVQVFSDFGFTGSYTRVFNVPVAISGVCANGFTSCDPGTWNNPAYYLWTMDANRGLDLVSASVGDVAGCYCVNASCGPVTDTKTILGHIGGAVVGAIQERDPRLIVTKVESTAASIKYYGQNSGRTTNLQGTYYSGPDNPETAYRSTSDAALNAETNRILSLQQSDPNSPYSAVERTFSNTEGPVNPTTCLIRRTIVLSSPVPTVSLSDTCAAMNPSTCKLKRERVCDYDGGNCVETYASFNPTLKKPLSHCKSIGSYVFCNDGNAITDTTAGTILSGTNVWYYIEREYQCQDANGYDFTAVTRRTADVENTTAISGNSVSYTDQGVSRSFGMPQTNDPGCEKVCKIRRRVAGTDVTLAGKVSDYRQDTTDVNGAPVRYNESYEYTYVPWVEDPADPRTGACQLPEEFDSLQEGEHRDYWIIPDPITNTIGSCRETFGDAIAVLQGIRAASDDMICSKE